MEIFCQLRDDSSGVLRIVECSKCKKESESVTLALTAAETQMLINNNHNYILVQALERTLRGGSPKLQWNAAAAASRLLGNPAVVAALPPAALTAVVRSAAAVVGSSGNLKACTQARHFNSAECQKCG